MQKITPRKHYIYCKNILDRIQNLVYPLNRIETD